MSHQEILEKIHKSISDHIDQITTEQKANSGKLEVKEAYVLVEYGKYFRTNKGIEDNDVDYSKMSIEEIDAEIARAAQSETDRKAKKK